MTKTYKCNACGGTFLSPQNGYLYFHACGPLSVDELIAAVDAGTVDVDAATRELVGEAKGPSGPDPQHPSAADIARERLRRLSVKRPGHVDQNITDTKARGPEDEPVGPISIGAGVTEVQP